jgi:hypothetical protein
LATSGKFPAGSRQLKFEIVTTSGEEAAMIEGDFDTRTLTMMNAALDRVCENIPRGEEYAVRKRIAKQIIKCAKSGKTTLSDLTAAGQRALIGIATSRNVPTPEGKVASPGGSARIA